MPSAMSLESFYHCKHFSVCQLPLPAVPKVIKQEEAQTEFFAAGYVRMGTEQLGHWDVSLHWVNLCVSSNAVQIGLPRMPVT